MRKRILTGQFRRAHHILAVGFLLVWPVNAGRADVKDDIVKVGEAIKKLPANDAKDAIDNLRNLLNSLRCDTVDCKIGLLEQFKASILAKEDPLNKDALSKNQLATILDKLQLVFMLGENFPTETAETIAGAFTATISKTKPDTGKENQQALAKRLFGDTAVAISTRYISELKTNLDAAETLKALAEESKKTPSFKEKVTSLQMLLANVAVPDGAKINVVEAWYGDFHSIRKVLDGRLRIDPDTGTGQRVCDATREVRSACQGRSFCPFAKEAKTPPDPSDVTLKIDGETLCGTNPVPNAAPGVAGLLVVYQCLARSSSEWNQLEIQPRSVAGADEYKKPIRTGSLSLIRCAAVQ